VSYQDGGCTLNEIRETLALQPIRGGDEPALVVAARDSEYGLLPTSDVT
jgi:hypothetical protein